MFENSVVEAFTRRLPPKSRSDFGRFLEIKGIDPTLDLDAFTLLGYTGAKLPDDGFEVIHPFENAGDKFQLVIEVAGFRYNSEVDESDISLSDQVDFEREETNELDEKAILIKLNGKKLGYVDVGRTELFHHYMSLGYSIDAHIFRKNGTAQRPLIYVFVSFLNI